MGDTPYSEGEVKRLDHLIDDLNAEPLAFVVHIGDITSGQGPCTDEWFAARKAQFARIKPPFVLLPGDKLQERRLASLEPVARRGAGVIGELCELAIEHAARTATGVHEHYLVDA